MSHLAANLMMILTFGVGPILVTVMQNRDAK